FQHGKAAVPFIQVKHTGRDAHGREGAKTSTPKHQLLPDSRARISAIETGSERPVIRSIVFYIGIEEKQVAASNLHAPDFGVNGTFASLDLHRDWLAILADRDLQGQLTDVSLQIFFLLPAINIQTLAKISLPIKQPDANQRNREIRCALDVVAGENAEAA